MSHKLQVKIVNATSQDRKALQELLEKANEYSFRLSKRLAWEKVEKGKEEIAHQLQLGNVYIIRGRDNTISSSITLSETNAIWRKFSEDNDALYFTKLIKDPDEAQANEAIELINFAAEEAQRRNKSYLRCDIVKDHVGILTYYKNLGFKERSHFHFEPSTREGILLEISISQLLKY